MPSSLKKISFNQRVKTPLPRRKRKASFPFKKVFFGFCILCLTLIIGAWVHFMQGIPSLDTLEKGDFFRESTIIYDKDGNEIYTIFKDGKRTYIPYEEVSQSIIDAIISTEDRTFFENPGIDLKGIIRVAATHITGGKYGRAGGASTISQQLIKNTLLTREVSIRRKVQEAYLSYRMNNEYSKEKILEMYLNTISFGHNANGVEQASRTFFGKSAKDVGPLGATILASLPNGPTRFSPYSNRERLMGKLEVYPSDEPSNRYILKTWEDKEKYAPLYREFKEYLSGMTVTEKGGRVEVCNVQESHINKNYIRRSIFLPDRRGCTNVAFENIGDFFGNISFSKSININGTTEDVSIEYTIGRKDFVAKQMFEDGKISGETYKKILYDGIDFEFERYREAIKYPYFVMYVKEYLETKYGKDIDITSGLRVYTTIDPKLQEKAEEIVKKQVEINKKNYGTTSASLISMDNTDGRLLAMVGGADYFDIENGGNNNMTLAPRQPGSSFKPFIYASAIAKYPIGPDSPVADVETKFGNWEPDNYDGKFNGIMTLKSALNYSRNIPAGKMYFLAGQQDEIVKSLHAMGIKNLKYEKEFSYGAPLSLGAGEVRAIDLMQAYSVLANNGIKKDIYMIERIETNNGTVIEKHTPRDGVEVFSPAASYITNKILSDVSSRPESTYWRNALSIGSKIVAVKTGTSNKPPKKGTTRILPGDLWTAGYTPQITTVVWAGNVDGSALLPKAESLNAAAPIWKGFMEYALKDIPSTDWKKPKDLYTYNIVKTSGKLASSITPQDQVVSTIMAVKLDQQDEGLKEVRIDTLCNGIATESTPEDAVKVVYIPSGKPIIDGFDPSWTTGFMNALRKIKGEDEVQEGVQYSDKPCEMRPDSMGNITIGIEKSDEKNIKISFLGDRMIKKMTIEIEGREPTVIDYSENSKKNGTESVSMSISKNTTITVTLLDIYGFRYGESRTILAGTAISGGDGSIDSQDISAPQITMINPRGKNLNLYKGDMFNLRFRVDIGTSTREIQVFVNESVYQTATSGEIFAIPVSSAGLDVGSHTIRITAIDGKFQSTESSFSLTILPR